MWPANKVEMYFSKIGFWVSKWFTVRWPFLWIEKKRNAACGLLIKCIRAAKQGKKAMHVPFPHAFIYVLEQKEKIYWASQQNINYKFY